MEDIKRKNIDLLVEEFWKRGYLTVSRKYGTYLPEPGKVGSFDVDIVARYKNDYAIGINLNLSDLTGSNLFSKLTYLASRHTKFSNKRVKLFVGVPAENFKHAKAIIDELEEDIRKNIKLFRIVDKSLPSVRRNRMNPNVLFS
jgi:hypothetical protein